jgi:hypothetical protein
MPVVARQLALGWLREEPGAVQASWVVLQSTCRQRDRAATLSAQSVAAPGTGPRDDLLTLAGCRQPADRCKVVNVDDRQAREECAHL